MGAPTGEEAAFGEHGNRTRCMRVSYAVLSDDVLLAYMASQELASVLFQLIAMTSRSSNDAQPSFSTVRVNTSIKNIKCVYIVSISESAASA